MKYHFFCKFKLKRFYPQPNNQKTLIIAIVWMMISILLAMSACATETEATPTSTPEIIATAMIARIEGKLVEIDGCLRVISSYSGTAYTLAWPADLSMTVDGNKVKVITGIVRGNPTEIILFIGEDVLLGGGEVKQLSEELNQKVPAHCPGPYWVVGYTIIPVEATE